MAKIKIKRVTSGGENYLENVNSYIHHKNENGRIVEPISRGAYGVNFDTPETATEEMMIVKKYFGKTEDNPLAHVMVCYGSSVSTEEKACELTEKSAEYFKDEYQLTYCTHGNDSECPNYHTHLCINSVNIKTGKLINSSRKDLNPFKEFITEITGEKSNIIFDNGKNKWEPK